MFLFCELQSFAQDGSDILYGKESSLNNSHVGKRIQVDFGRHSGLNFRLSIDKKKNRSLDTLYIVINGKSIPFIEHREDNGFNNWFGRQYLIRASNSENSSAKIPYFIIEKITKDRLFVRGFISYESMGSSIDTITPFQHAFLRTDIREILFDAKDFRKK